MTLFKRLILIGILSFPFTVAAGQSYKSVKVKKKITQVKVESDLLKELTPLVDRERKCDYYQPSLIWSIRVTKVEGDYYILNISMQREVNPDFEYSGYFYLDRVLFLISGQMPNDLIRTLGSTELEFNVKEPIKTDDSFLYVTFEDYSSWLYLYKDEELILKEQYLLPCK